MQALDLATPTLREIARDAGLGYHALRQYRKGARTPSAEVLARLADALRARARRLGVAALKLEHEALHRAGAR